MAHELDLLLSVTLNRFNDLVTNQVHIIMSEPALIKVGVRNVGNRTFPGGTLTIEEETYGLTMGLQNLRRPIEPIRGTEFILPSLAAQETNSNVLQLNIMAYAEGFIGLKFKAVATDQEEVLFRGVPEGQLWLWALNPYLLEILSLLRSSLRKLKGVKVKGD